MLCRRKCVNALGKLVRGRCHLAAEEKEGGLFGVAGLTDERQFERITTETIERCQSLHKLILSGEGDRPAVHLIDDLSNEICATADLAECVRLLHPARGWKKEAERCVVHIGAYVERLNTDKRLYTRLRECLDSSDGLDDVDRRVGSLLLDDFEDSGVHLSDDKKSEFVALTTTIFETGADLVEMMEAPAVVPQHHPCASDLLTVGHYSTADNRLYLRDPCVSSADAAIRSAAYSVYHGRDEGGRERRMRQLFAARHRLAEVTGFRSYAKRCSQRMLLNTPHTIEEFLVHLADALRPMVADELQAMGHVLRSTTAVRMSDIPYATALARHSIIPSSSLTFDARSIVAHFDRYVSHVFGITLEEETDCPSHHLMHASHVTVYNARRVDDGRFLGTIYVDLYAREAKMGGDCHMTVRCGKEMADGRRQTPIIVLSLNLRSPSCHVHELENMWHELGHALHSMAALTRHQHVSGTRCSTDMAEVPSTLMEYALYDETVLRRAYPSLSPSDVTLMTTARRVFSAVHLQQQVVHALFDLRAHDRVDDQDDARMVEGYNEMQAHYMCVEEEEHVFWPNRFTHIVPYGGKYSAYLVAHAAARLLWNKLFVADPFDRRAGEAWWTAQSFGGERPMNELVGGLLGQEITSSVLADALIQEVKINQEVNEMFIK